MMTKKKYLGPLNIEIKFKFIQDLRVLRKLELNDMLRNIKINIVDANISSKFE